MKKLNDIFTVALYNHEKSSTNQRRCCYFGNRILAKESLTRLPKWR